MLPALGLQTAPPQPAPAILPSAPPVTNIGGFLPVASQAQVLQQQRADAQAATQVQQAQPVITGLAGHIKNFFSSAQSARQRVEQAMLEATYSRRGEYTPSELQEIVSQGQTPIYMMLFSVKCRQAESLLRDVLGGTGTDKPWTLKPTPSPELPPDQVEAIKQEVTAELAQAYRQGLFVTPEQIRVRLREAKGQLEAQVMEEARARAERMERKMEDQLVEGGFHKAIDQFLTDLPQFKTAFIKGPLIRNKPRLKWGPAGVVVERQLVMEWERVDPFNMYPAPWAKDLQTAPFVERVPMTRSDLNDLVGVPGFNEAAIRTVLTEYDNGQTSFWLSVDAQKAAAEGRDNVAATTNTGIIDTLVYWGSASGKMLREWGLPAEQIADETKEYQIEAWFVGTTVIKAVLNPDPLGRRPYYNTSYERIPGSVWGNSMYDLMRDCQQMCNGAARALASNMAISSGPQVVFLRDRLATGEDVTSMFPWKIWQMVSDPMGSTIKPIDFFQPTSNATELMAVYEKFSVLADEYTGIPRYMAGLESGSIGRTASGLSMMVGNASKIIKQVVGGVDVYILTDALERQFQHNMLYSDDEDLKGDAQIVARGALSLTTKEAAAVRRNEFLQLVLNSPVALQVVGMDGVAALLREQVKGLDMNSDRVVPPLSVLQQRAMQAMMMAQAQSQQQGTPAKPETEGQQLTNGAPVTDHFEPMAQAS